MSTRPDFQLLSEATRNLLGYFVHTWFGHYLNVVGGNLKRWYEEDLLQKDTLEPTPFASEALLFDFNSLNLEKLAYINGIYFYILACHKGANHYLMNRYDGKQILYLRGYDYEGSVATGGDLAMGFSSIDTTRFNSILSKLLSPHFHVFKVFSPKDVYWETADAQRYFLSEFEDIIRYATLPMRSIYVNALRWKDDLSNLFDRMDHFVVYVSSITDGVMWELDQLDQDNRRGRVTVVFDAEAIQNKELQLGLRDKMSQEYGDKLIWLKPGHTPTQSSAELRAHLSQKFFLTTPEEFQDGIGSHRERIAASSSSLPPGRRETWLDFHFQPAVDAEKLQELYDFAASVESRIAAGVANGIQCLPLFLNDVQMRIFMTLLLGDHFQTGLALAGYAAVMQAAFDYYARPEKKPGDLSPEGREKHLNLLQQHLQLGRHISLRLLAFGKSNEFSDFSSRATADFNAAFSSAKSSVDKFFGRRLANTASA